MLTKTIIENIFLLIGESFWAFSVIAQLRKVLKTHKTHGLSAPSITLNAAGNIGWIVYFIHRQLWFPVATNIVVVTGAILLLGAVLENNRLQYRRGLAAIFTIGPLTSLLLIGFPAIGGWLGMSYNWIAGTPWLIHVMTSKKLTGISTHSLFFTWGAITSVLIYGSLIHATPLVVGSLQGIAYQIVIGKRYFKYRHQG
ncbi:MAG TPA: PQ-loop repeat-containing protein [Candidatus Saccharimonadales bacterium]|nr:PQ-loop repeat-containing protein [Candidatus Saccharimonadales bacterium]